jgi:hypothetical protein
MKKPQSRQAVPQPRFELGTSWIQVRSVITWANLLSFLVQCCTESTVMNKSQEGTYTTATVNCRECDFCSTCEMTETMLHHYSSEVWHWITLLLFCDDEIMYYNRLMCARDYWSAHEVLILLEPFLQGYAWEYTRCFLLGWNLN